MLLLLLFCPICTASLLLPPLGFVSSHFAHLVTHLNTCEAAVATAVTAAAASQQDDVIFVPRDRLPRGDTGKNKMLQL